MSAFPIVAAHPSDLADVTGLLAACNLPHEDLTPAHLASFQVVRQGRRLVAVIGLERFGGDGLLRSLAVLPDYRKKGLGGSLVAALESRARQSGITRLYLLTETASDFFARRGYLHIARGQTPQTIQGSAEFASLCPTSATSMCKPLT